MRRKIKVYADQCFLPGPDIHNWFLQPIWGRHAEAWHPGFGANDRWCAEGASWIELTDLANAELAVLPADWREYLRRGPNAIALAHEFIQRCRENNVPVWLTYADDSTEAVAVVGAVVSRPSLRRSQQKPNEVACPAFCEDIPARYRSGRAEPRQYTATPVVSFCGHAPGAFIKSTNPMRNLRNAVKTKVRDAALRFGMIQRADGSVRTRAIKYLQAESAVETRFLLRNSFQGGVVDASSYARHEFVHNILESDYVLCARGVGNYSWRLYEALSCGRIPLLVDTDCVLPFEGVIPWKDLCVIVDQSDVGRIGKKLLHVHRSLGADTFRERQQACRDVWEKYLTPFGYFSHLLAHPEYWRPSANKTGRQHER